MGRRAEAAAEEVVARCPLDIAQCSAIGIFLRREREPCMGKLIKICMLHEFCASKQFVFINQFKVKPWSPIHSLLLRGHRKCAPIKGTELYN